MDPIPNETHGSEIEATVADLERGLTEFPRSKAVNRIDDWRREIEATERADLQPVADALGELHQALVGEGLDGARIGGLLVRLGEMTEAAEASDAVRPKLQRLGSLLRHAGSALRGNAQAAPAADPATDPAA